MDFLNYPLFMENRERGRYEVLHWINGGGGTLQLAPNLNLKSDPVLQKLFQDSRFRIALSHAINRDEINEICFFGIGKPRQLCPPPASPFYSAAYERAYIDYDPAKANALLDEMGLTKNKSGVRLRPDGVPITVYIETTSMTGNNRLLEMVAAYWTAVGVKTDVKMTARQLFYARKSALMHHVGVWWPGDELIPVIDPRWFLPFSAESIHAIGYARWFNSGGKTGIEPTGDIRTCIELYQQIQQTPDEAEQRRLFAEIIKLNQKNLWVIGTIGEMPAIMLKSHSFRNVPEVAVSGWIFRTPGNTAPECYAIDPGGDLSEEMSPPDPPPNTSGWGSPRRGQPLPEVSAGKSAVKTSVKTDSAVRESQHASGDRRERCSEDRVSPQPRLPRGLEKSSAVQRRNSLGSSWEGVWGDTSFKKGSPTLPAIP
jgi:peptide/nickel transport system substrate-binding protein